jgi:5'-deoxynucleotidase YfbR-like HD superfamily hydrolase
MDEASPFPFLGLTENLKNIVRRGWDIRNIEGPESIADHMYQMGVIAMFIPNVQLHKFC